MLALKEAAGHVIKEISDAEVFHRQALSQQMNDWRISLTEIQGNMEKLDQEMARLTAVKGTNREDIEKIIQYMHKKVEERKQQLIEINEITFQDAQNYVLSIRKARQGETDMINKNLDLSEKAVKNGTLHEVIHAHQKLTSTAEEIQPESPELEFRQPCIIFDLNKGKKAVEISLHRLGQINFKEFLPEMCELKCDGALVGQKAAMQVQLFSQGKEVNRHKASGIFRRYHISCEQKQLSVSSNNPVLKFGQEGKGNGTFDQPLSIAIDNNDFLYVADCGNGLIQKFTTEGKFVSQFSVALRSKKYTTSGMALDADRGLLFCMEIKKQISNLPVRWKSILVFNLEGELQHSYSPPNISNAHHIAINAQGELVVSDFGGQRLCKLDSNGNFLCHMGKFKWPGCIAITDDGTMIVPDFIDDRVYILNKDGTVRHQFGSSGTGKGKLKQPCGVAHDGENILVAEQGNDRIQVFKFSGKFVSVIDSSDDPIRTPSGLAVSKDGHVYLADRKNHCIKKYKYRELPK